MPKPLHTTILNMTVSHFPACLRSYLLPSCISYCSECLPHPTPVSLSSVSIEIDLCDKLTLWVKSQTSVCLLVKTTLFNFWFHSWVQTEHVCLHSRNTAVHNHNQWVCFCWPDQTTGGIVETNTALRCVLSIQSNPSPGDSAATVLNYALLHSFTHIHSFIHTLKLPQLVICLKKVLGDILPFLSWRQRAKMK